MKLCVLVCERGVKGCGEEEDVWYRREGRSLAVCVLKVVRN